MQLSVIVCVYNAGEYLNASVESILAQNCEGLEVILVDDGSTDGSGESCDAWAAREARVKVLHKPNGGVSSARNAGLNAATGEFVTFVDADDTVEPEAYAAALAAAHKGNCQVVGHGYRVIDQDGAVCHSMPAFAISSIGELRPYFMEYTSKASIFGSVCNKLYRRCFLEENGLRSDETLHGHEDEAFNFTVLARLQRMAWLDECPYNYMMRDNASITRKGTLSVYAAGQAAEKYAAAFFEAVPELADLREEYLEGRRQRALYNHFSQLTGRNRLRFGQRRAALREVARDEAARGVLLRRLGAESGAGAGLARLLLRWRLPGALAAAVCVRNALA